jgi:site-specific recombinase XerD
VLVLLLLGHGLRIAEVLTADLPGCASFTTLEVRSKGGPVRCLVLSQPARRALRRAAAGRTDGPLLLGARGARLGRSSAVRLLQGLGEQVLLDQRGRLLHPHACRRAFVVTLLARGAALRDVQHALGHRSAVQTLAYADVLQHHGVMTLSLLTPP